MRAGVVLGSHGNKTHADVVGGVLLQHLNIVKSVGVRPETLNKPRSRLTPVPKNLTLNLARSASAKENLSRHLRVRGRGVVQRETCSSSEERDKKERGQEPDQAGPGGKHGDDLVCARHSAKDKKQCQEQRNGQQDDKNLWDLRSIIFQDPAQAQVLIEKGRDAVADIEDQPDRDETGNAVEVSLHEISRDIPVKQSHNKFSIKPDSA